MKLYRVEHTNQGVGMWTYRDSNNLLVLEHLSDKRLLEMPMPDDPVFRLKDKEWKTAVNNMADMSYWFTLQDVKEMAQHGFVMLEFECDEVQVEQYQVLYVAHARFNVKDITQEWIEVISR